MSFISICSGHIIISYVEVTTQFSVYRMDFTKKIEMLVDFADVKNNENMSKGKTYRMYYAKQLLYFDLFLM